jgi:hypothetical protein
MSAEALRTGWLAEAQGRRPLRSPFLGIGWRDRKPFNAAARDGGRLPSPTEALATAIYLPKKFTLSS